ncbi:hypothetical protein CCUS01_08388 [Colletotrichum cuscutae]|uniref:Rhodopsin domain-containing protein n=1 Tax=Colletotrichum cuscutae TaxID=1209917 RepID=A0AAI9XTA0_9PEZI|nr:hypothetical protein CCUS01_08388 [Colletotrichum cuscutae]
MSNTTIPSGVVGPGAFLPSDTRQPLVIGITSMFIVLIAIFMAIRVYIRGYLLRGWELDDSVFMWSSMLVIVQGAMVLCILVYQLSFGFIKTTFLLQFRRAFALPHIILFCDIFLGIMFLALIGLLIFGGIVMRDFLKPGYVPTPGEKAYLIFGYVNAAVHLSTDIVIFILPLAFVGQMRLAAMQKAGLISSFGVGIFTSAISVLRIVSLPLATSGIDGFYQAVPLVLLSMAEPTSAVICACVPIMRPLLACSGTSRYGSQGSRRPLSGATNESAGQRRQTPSAPPQSPTSTTSQSVTQMTYKSTITGSIDGDLEGYTSSQQARGSINTLNPLSMHPSSPTKTAQFP